MKDLGYETGTLRDNIVGNKRKGLGIEAKQKTISKVSKMSIIWDTEVMEGLMKQYIPLNERKNYIPYVKKSENTTKVMELDW